MMIHQPSPSGLVMRLLVTTRGKVVTRASHDEIVESDGADILIHNGQIERIESSTSLVEEFDATGPTSNVQVFDVGDRAIIPGLIDAHTHLIWAGDRSDEVGKRLSGMSYHDIAAQGGGIGRTVRATAAASLDDLRSIGAHRAAVARRSGTTYMEAKSGYGLSTVAELNQIQAAHDVGLLQGLPGVHTTWLGAHAIPEGDDETTTVERLLTEQLPAVIEQGLAQSADVFCEPGWFSLESTESLLKASMSAGLSGRLHIDEFVDGGGASLAADLGVVTADHALKSTPSGRQAMADAGVITGYLPGTPHLMNLAMPSISSTPGTFTVASDFNPNCPTLSLPFSASLAVHHAGLTPAAALAAVTTSAALSVPRSDGLVHGELSVGAAGSLNVLDGATWESWCLSPGHDPFSMTVVDGIPTLHEDTLHPAPSQLGIQGV
jgi:imidazolonepropionase